MNSRIDSTTLAPPPNAYLQRYGKPDPARVRTTLYLFPYAGGSAAVFRKWPEYFDDSYDLVGIQLPGRGSRLMEPAEIDYRVLVRDIADALIADRRHARFAIYGHSMGALLAHHVALDLLRRGAGQPDCLFLSGCKAPHLARARRQVSGMSDADFLDELRRLEGTPAALLDNAELMQLLLPTIKADFMLLDRWYDDLARHPAPRTGAADLRHERAARHPLLARRRRRLAGTHPRPAGKPGIQRRPLFLAKPGSQTGRRHPRTPRHAAPRRLTSAAPHSTEKETP